MSKSATYRQHDWDEEVATRSAQDNPYAQLAAQNYELDQAVLLFDAKHAANRAFHTRELSDAEGRDTSVLHGLLELVVNACRAANTRRWMLVWDGGVQYKRKVYSAYKSRHDRERTPEEQERHARLNQSIKVARKAFDDIGAPQLYLQDIEADDAIGLASHKIERIEQVAMVDARFAKLDSLTALIVSDDKDYYQLLSDRCHVWRGITQQHYTPQRFKTEFGFTPHSYIDYKALVGEAATGDNIPKVPGIGDVWAAKLVAAHGGIDDIIKFCRERCESSKKPLAKETAVVSCEAQIKKIAYPLSKIARDRRDLKTWGFTISANKMLGVVEDAIADAVNMRETSSTDFMRVWSRHGIRSIDWRDWSRVCGFGA